MLGAPLNDHADPAVPDQCRDKIADALRMAFGSARVDRLAPLGGGVSGAYPFLVEVAGQRYVLRIEGKPSPLRNSEQYKSMAIAAEAGLSPRLHYVDEA